jgi:hypothetical protein
MVPESDAVTPTAMATQAVRDFTARRASVDMVSPQRRRFGSTARERYSRCFARRSDAAMVQTCLFVGVLAPIAFMMWTGRKWHLTDHLRRCAQVLLYRARNARSRERT